MVTSTRWPARTIPRCAVVAAASFLSGALTFFAQGFLPDAVESFANSASGWTLVTVLLLVWAQVRTAVAGLLGALSFILLTVGYSAAAELQDLYYDPTLFALVGVFVGPFVGIAATWLRSASLWRAVAGTVLLAGIAVGEAVYGLTVVADTTSSVYWILIGVVGLALLITMLVHRIHGLLWVVLALVGTIVVAGVFVTAYRGLGGV